MLAGRLERRSKSKLKRYQSTSALLNFLALDRLDIAFAVKELMRRMSGPTPEDEVEVPADVPSIDLQVPLEPSG